MRNTKNEKFKIYDYKDEYQDYKNSIDHIVATDLSRPELEKLVVNEGIDIVELGMYVIVPLCCSEAFDEHYKNEEKYDKRTDLKGDAYGYEDGVMEQHHKELVDSKELIDIIIVSEEEIIEEKKINKMNEAITMLTEKQQKRLTLFYEKKMSYEAIAELENCSKQSVYESVAAAIKKLKKLCGVISK